MATLDSATTTAARTRTRPGRTRPTIPATQATAAASPSAPWVVPSPCEAESPLPSGPNERAMSAWVGIDNGGRHLVHATTDPPLPTSGRITAIGDARGALTAIPTIASLPHRIVLRP